MDSAAPGRAVSDKAAVWCSGCLDWLRHCRCLRIYHTLHTARQSITVQKPISLLATTGHVVSKMCLCASSKRQSPVLSLKSALQLMTRWPSLPLGHLQEVPQNTYMNILCYNHFNAIIINRKPYTLHRRCNTHSCMRRRRKKLLRWLLILMLFLLEKIIIYENLIRDMDCSHKTCSSVPLGYFLNTVPRKHMLGELNFNHLDIFVVVFLHLTQWALHKCRFKIKEAHPYKMYLKKLSSCLNVLVTTYVMHWNDLPS